MKDSNNVISKGTNSAPPNSISSGLFNGLTQPLSAAGEPDDGSVFDDWSVEDSLTALCDPMDFASYRRLGNLEFLFGLDCLAKEVASKKMNVGLTRHRVPRSYSEPDNLQSPRDQGGNLEVRFRDMIAIEVAQACSIF